MICKHKFYGKITKCRRCNKEYSDLTISDYPINEDAPKEGWAKYYDL